MPAVTELDLPSFDYTDQSLRGERYHATMAEVERSGDWLAERTARLRRSRPRGRRVLPAHPGRDLPRAEDRRAVRRSPTGRCTRRSSATSSTSTASRPRAAAQPAQPGAVATRGRSPPAGDEGDPRAAVRQLRGDGACDFVTDFAKPYPSLVIAHLLGDPDRGRSAAARLVELDPAPVRRREPGRPGGARADRAGGAVEYHEWAQQMLARKRAAHRRGPRSSELLSPPRTPGTRGGRGGQPRARRDPRRDRHRAEPALAHRAPARRASGPVGRAARRPVRLAVSAVEEAFRYEPVTPFTARITTEPIESTAGSRSPTNTVVMVSAFHANRDDVDGGFDISHHPRARPAALTFGAGIHYCVGANVARAELQEALTFLAAARRADRARRRAGVRHDHRDLRARRAAAALPRPGVASERRQQRASPHHLDREVDPDRVRAAWALEREADQSAGGHPG